MRLILESVEMEGALLRFKDGAHGLVREKEQSITREWVVGDRLDVSVAHSPVFRMESVDTEEVAHAIIYKGTEQLVELAD